jgi:hypothetical protein
MWADGEMGCNLLTTIEIDGDFITFDCACQSKSQAVVRGEEEIYSKSSYISTISTSQRHCLHKWGYMVVKFKAEKRTFNQIKTTLWPSDTVSEVPAPLLTKSCRSILCTWLVSSFVYVYIDVEEVKKNTFFMHWRIINNIVKAGGKTWLYIVKFTNTFILFLGKWRGCGIYKRDRKCI